MNILIFKASSEHTEEISRICSVGWRQTVQGVYSEEYQNRNVEYWYNHNKVHDDIVKGIYTHVAMVDNKVVGTIGGTISGSGVSEIYVFYIDELYRYKGIGKRLLNAFTTEHMKQGATKQYASVEENNKLGIPFYEARGFKQDEETKRYWRKLT